MRVKNKVKNLSKFAHQPRDLKPDKNHFFDFEIVLFFFEI